MGYQSQAAFALDKGLYFKYEMMTGALPELLKKSTRQETDEAYYWLFSGYKWYSRFEEIAEIESFMQKLTNDCDANKKFFKKEDVEWGFGFIRIGEDTEDLVYEGDYWEYGLHIERDIDTPFGMLAGADGVNY